MIEGFDRNAKALGNQLNVVLQCGFHVRMTQVRLDALDGRDLSHIRGTRPSEHLMRRAGDASLFDQLPSGPEKEIIGIDGGPPPRRKDEFLWGSILAGRSP